MSESETMHAAASDPEFDAEIAEIYRMDRIKAEMARIKNIRNQAETLRALNEQRRRCAAGEHVYTWSGQLLDVPGGSPHEVMGCAYGAVHDPDIPQLKLIGPLYTAENRAKMLWTKEELEEHRVGIPLNLDLN